MGLQKFKSSQAGILVRSILESPDGVARMISASLQERPALEAVGADIAAGLGNLSDTERKDVGRWACEILGRHGWVPDRKRRIAPGNLFAYGTIYRQLRPERQLSGAARLAKARQLLQLGASKPLDVDAFIADRHRAFAAGE